MASFEIIGGKPLSGKVKAAGNKNAVLKMIPATLLTSDEVVLTNVPAISDVEVMIEIMKSLGTQAHYDKSNGVLKLKTEQIITTNVDPKLAGKLRASNMFLGPILARMGEVKGVIPGGDKIGPREMNAHFDGFEQLGAKVEHIDDITFRIYGQLKGDYVFLYEPSVTATENIILASVIATGHTTIYNAACEPHVQELCLMLNQMGAKITGIGTNKLEVDGVEKLGGTEYKIPPDFMYVGTMIVLALITGGQLEIEDVNHDDMRTVLYFFSKFNVKTEKYGDSIKVLPNQKLEVTDATWARTKGFYSQPWPCFPTDLMSLAIVLATQTNGSTLFFEKMYSGRMSFANYLNGMGANIILADPHRIFVSGKTQLFGIKGLASPDLRAGMAYVAAALCAEGKSVVGDIEHIDRGYPNIELTLRDLGADIVRI